MRQQIVAGNWKMNTTRTSGVELASAILEKMPAHPNGLVVLCVPFTHLDAVSSVIAQAAGVHLGAQNFHQEEKGAYTGEISADMLLDVQVEYVLIGHSERREYFKEDNALLARKVDLALAKNLSPIFCCGEPLEIRENGTFETYVAQQIKESLFHLTPDQFKRVALAYEPIWAIGTGKTASSQQAQDMHAAIRQVIAEQYGQEIADDTTILYGGSCNAQNAAELFAQPDVDGGLIGGASLKADDFVTIVSALKVR